MGFIVFASAIDVGLSRLDSASFPQQTLMEMMIDGMPDKACFCDKHGAFLDIEDWDKVSLNNSSEVVGIGWRGWRKYSHSYFEHSGIIDLRWMPSTVEIFTLTGSAISGTVDLPGIPKGLTYLYLQRNQLFGTLDLTELSEKLDNLILHTNQFGGTIDLTNLPRSLKFLDLYKNQLRGRVRVAKLSQDVLIQLFETSIESVVDENGKMLEHERIILTKPGQ